ncbi:MAG: hypothetical protein HY036_11750 [Nitrospirae bacterium]|nr:hypothetical protein [Nitrospirota bacterium]MBI3353235.1 hypothetical protein [Nitrospirota bacterium]
MILLSILRIPKTLAPICFFLFFVLLTGCGKEDPAPPAVQNTTTDQIVILQTNPPAGGGQTGSGAISGVKISSVPLPQPLFQTSSVTYTDSISGLSYIYVLGGAYYDSTLSTDPINVDTVYRYLVLVQPTTVVLSDFAVEKNRLPVSLRGHSSIIYNNAIYVIGGIGMGFQKTIYRAAITMDSSVKPPVPLLGPWQWVGDLPVEETGQASVVLGNRLYVVGGVESGFPPPNCSPNCVGSQSTVFSEKIYGYNLTTDLTGPGYSVSSVYRYTMPKKLYTAAAVADASRLWVMGGWDGIQNSNTVYTFDANVFSGALSCSPSSCVPGELPNGVGISKAVGLYLQDIQKFSGIFLLGGVSGTLNTPEIIRREVFSSTPASLLTWNQEISLPKPVTYFSATSAQGAIFVIGGLQTGP